MHRNLNIQLIADWRSAEIRARLLHGVESLTRCQTLAEMRHMRPSATTYETVGRKLTSLQRAMERMIRIAKGLPAFHQEDAV